MHSEFEEFCYVILRNLVLQALCFKVSIRSCKCHLGRPFGVVFSSFMKFMPFARERYQISYQIYFFHAGKNIISLQSKCLPNSLHHDLYMCL